VTDLALRYPPAVLEARSQAAAGGLRERVRYDLVPRPHHAFGLLTAADVARFAGVGRITAAELGVAEGDGLRNLAELAAEVTAETGVQIDVVGFDSGAGLPPPADARDHPEIWAHGDFAMPDPARLRAGLPEGTDLVIGPVAETVPAFLPSLDGRPLGFVSIDLDLYRSTRDALVLAQTDAARLLPVVVCHFDDVLGGTGRIGSLFRTEAAGQLLAIREFNAAEERHGSQRHLDPIRILRHRRPLDREPWLERMYALHVLDHPFRAAPAARPARSMSEHAADADMDWPV
jgi:hypothetical protein